MRYALINKKTNVVENVIEWDGSPYKIPEEYFHIASDIVDRFDVWDPDLKIFIKHANTSPN